MRVKHVASAVKTTQRGATAFPASPPHRLPPHTWALFLPPCSRSRPPPSRLLLAMKRHQRVQSLPKNPLQMAATGNGFLDASPSVLTFDGVPTSGKPLRAVLMIRNTTMRTLRLKIRMPMTDQFQVSPSEVRVVLAGGLRYKLRIACRPWDHSEQGAKQSRHDRIQFVLANGRFSEIKLHAYAPRALFECPHLDVGKVLQDAGCRRVVLLRNVGTRTGTLSLESCPMESRLTPCALQSSRARPRRWPSCSTHERRYHASRLLT